MSVPIHPHRRRLFPAVALAIPIVVFAGLEGGLRLAAYGGDLALFVRPGHLHGRYATVNPRFGARYFVGDEPAPTAPHDVFRVAKGANGFRVFVLGESAAAGFPYGYNGTFSRVLRDALQDVMPDREVEVVNVAMAAVSTYVLYDQLDDILRERPDAVVIYAGHNEFYGVFGAGSATRVAAPPGVTRASLGLLRLRSVRLARSVLAGVVGRPGPNRDSSASLMRRMAGGGAIPLGSPVFRRGQAQLESNLNAILSRLQGGQVPVVIGSLVSNIRDQAPFYTVVSDTLPPAAEVFTAAQAALRRGAIKEARGLFASARDLDALRFRAPGVFNDVLRRIAAETGAHYAPVAEAFEAAAPDGIPGADLFWEHLHPNQRGYHLMARVFFEALLAAGILGDSADTARLAPWPQYLDRMALTEFDQRFAWHQVRLLKSRWPFVAEGEEHLAAYTAAGPADTLAALAVYGGMGWIRAKVALAEWYERRGAYALALAEYRGLMREDAHNASPFTRAARLHLLLGQPDSARVRLERAYALTPSGFVCYALGSLELRAARYRRAISLLEESLAYAPGNASALFDLSRAYALAGDEDQARQYADRLQAIHPRFPGLAGWRAVLDSSRTR